jgi:hypothetical protein
MVRNLGAKGGVEAAGTDEEASMKSLVTGAAGDWKVITFSGPPPSWTDNLTQLEYSPAADLLQRGSEFVKLSPSLAASVEAGRSIAPPGSGFPWLYVAIAALAVAACASALLVIRRSRLPRAPEARIDLS